MLSASLFTVACSSLQHVHTLSEAAQGHKEDQQELMYLQTRLHATRSLVPAADTRFALQLLLQIGMLSLVPPTAAAWASVSAYMYINMASFLAATGYREQWSQKHGISNIFQNILACQGFRTLQSSKMEAFYGLIKFFFLHLNSSYHLLQLFGRWLQSLFPVKLQQCGLKNFNWPSISMRVSR